MNYFGRMAYNYKEKYLAEFVWRYDGSYMFAEGNLALVSSLVYYWDIVFLKKISGKRTFLSLTTSNSCILGPDG